MGRGREPPVTRMCGSNLQSLLNRFTKGFDAGHCEVACMVNLRSCNKDFFLIVDQLVDFEEYEVQRREATLYSAVKGPNPKLKKN
jgi:hypothetical protein